MYGNYHLTRGINNRKSKNHHVCHKRSYECVIMPFSLVCCGCDTSYIVSVHIQCQVSIYTLSLCRGHSWRVRLAKQETLTPPGHLVSPLVWWGPWMSTVVLCCLCHSDSASVLLYFTFFCILHCYKMFLCENPRKAFLCSNCLVLYTNSIVTSTYRKPSLTYCYDVGQIRVFLG